MTYTIDQSGKIEQTNLNTILAACNGRQISILFTKQNKRILQLLFKKQGKIKIFTVLTFASLIALLIQKNQLKNRVIIDHEYLTYENFIKERVLSYLQILKTKVIPQIEFGHVGKTSKAHHLAAKVAHQKQKAGFVIELAEVLGLIFQTKRSGIPLLTGPRAT